MTLLDVMTHHCTPLEKSKSIYHTLFPFYPDEHRNSLVWLSIYIFTVIAGHSLSSHWKARPDPKRHVYSSALTMLQPMRADTWVTAIGTPCRHGLGTQHEQELNHTGLRWYISSFLAMCTWASHSPSLTHALDISQKLIEDINEIVYLKCLTKCLFSNRCSENGKKSSLFPSNAFAFALKSICSSHSWSVFLRLSRNGMLSSLLTTFFVPHTKNTFCFLFVAHVFLKTHLERHDMFKMQWSNLRYKLQVWTKWKHEEWTWIMHWVAPTVPKQENWPCWVRFSNHIMWFTA